MSKGLACLSVSRKMITVFLAGLDMDFHLESKRFEYMHYVNSLFLKLVRDNPSVFISVTKERLNCKTVASPQIEKSGDVKVFSIIDRFRVLAPILERIS